MAEYLTEREEARERLKASVDALAHQANLQVQLQKDPLKMLGGASAVGAVIGLVMGRQFRRTRKVYVDAQSPVKHQKALLKAQKSHKGGGVGGALVATLGTLAVKTVMDKVVTPRLEGLADQLLDKAGQPRDPRAAQQPAQKPGGVGAFVRSAPALAAPATAAQSYAQQAPAEGSSPPAAPTTPVSTVEAKAQGSVIRPDEMINPNSR
ncbi:hypothetical protein LAJ19_08000 [Deinococcus taeanensis]|uniref:hypothetical protein n=1 Tax=Deinococcus taeanensis TaxID=2737050 RepID=UPI001CDC979C|nr:hypothetical protein [Deinococcus taeanensis]UBV41606.1 hypothetical protein LAJ19_08000 [Deinococcus taeanensis]